MEAFIEFGRGPLLKFSFAIMVLGLIRIFALGLYGFGRALYNVEDRSLNYKDIAQRTLQWLLPNGRWLKMRPNYSLVSILFHIGLIFVPILLAAHLNLLCPEGHLSFAALPQFFADLLTLLTIITGLGLFFGRLLYSPSRAISRFQDYFWPLLLIVPAFSGFLCASMGLSATAWQFWMMIHIYAANLILILVPFTKIAHCVLMPLTQLISTAGWKFPEGAGDKVAATLGKRGQSI